MTDSAVTDLTRGIYRRVYSGFIKGQRINRLPLESEAWFWRVLAAVDDFGNMEAEPELFRDATAGRRTITTQQAAQHMCQMAGHKLIEFYEVRGELYLHIIGFEDMQPAGKNGRRIRRCPIPDESQKIQGIPDVVSVSDNEDDNDSENDNETELVVSRAKPRSTRSIKICDEEYLEGLQSSDAYRRLDVKHVHAKMAVWCQNKGKQATRGRLINWLNREDQPLEFKAPKLPKSVNPIVLPPRPDGVVRWECGCGFDVLQNGNGLKNCPECGSELIKADGITR
jgi:hypothetical protein